jgi:hypothetical protein
MTASDPRYESPVTGRPSREADLGRVSLPSVLGTSGTLRVGSTNRVTESSWQSSRCRTFLDKVALAGRSWPPAEYRRWPVRPPRLGKHCRAGRCQVAAQVSNIGR